MQVNLDDGQCYGSGVYSQPYLPRGAKEKMPGIKSCTISVLNDRKLNDAIADFIQNHPEMEIYKTNNRPQLRIRFVNPVFRQVNIGQLKQGNRWNINSKFDLVGCEEFKIHEATDER